MKKLFAFMLIGLVVFNANAQSGNAETKPVTDVLLLKQSSYDFGKIQQGRPVTHIFEVVNTGTEPIRLENVQATCGCTTPEWNRDLIQPGASATIKVGYNSASEGAFNKTVAVTYTGGLVKNIIISGNVYKGTDNPGSCKPVIDIVQTK